VGGALAGSVGPPAANAAKYGALGHPEGKLLVSWTVSDVLDLEWKERGSPAQSAPTKTGFGGTERTVETQFA
jgi:two-component sensor histidine kinase